MLLSVCICFKTDQRSQRTAKEQDTTPRAAQAINEALYAGVLTKLLLLAIAAVTLTHYFPATSCCD